MLNNYQYEDYQLQPSYFGSLIRVTRLKVTPNTADPISLKENRLLSLGNHGLSLALIDSYTILFVMTLVTTCVFRGVEWVHGLFLFPLVLEKCSCHMQNWVFFV